MSPCPVAVTNLLTLNKIGSLSKPQFCHLSPTYDKYLLDPTDLFGLLAQWDVFAVAFPIFSFLVFVSVSWRDPSFIVTPRRSF